MEEHPCFVYCTLMMVLFKTLMSRWCNKVSILSLRLYCIVFWYITLVTSTYVWKTDHGTQMLCIWFCPQNRVWQDAWAVLNCRRGNRLVVHSHSVSGASNEHELEPSHMTLASASVTHHSLSYILYFWVIITLGWNIIGQLEEERRER
jgi:hypothetical protein